MGEPAFREISITADSLFRFLRAITQEQPVRIEHERIPKTAALAAGVRFDEATRTITLKVFDQWRDHPELAGQPNIELVYSQRVSEHGNASDWGTPTLLTAEPRPAADVEPPL